MNHPSDDETLAADPASRVWNSLVEDIELTAPDPAYAASDNILVAARALAVHVHATTSPRDVAEALHWALEDVATAVTVLMTRQGLDLTDPATQARLRHIDIYDHLADILPGLSDASVGLRVLADNT